MNTHTIKFQNLLFLVIPILVFSNLIFAWQKADFLTPDSLDYIKLAKSLPKIENSLFPIFYPLILKICNFFFDNYTVTYKIVNIVSLLFCFLYTLKKDFFWREIWTILAFPSFQFVYMFGWSENIILPLLIIYFHITYLFFNGKLTYQEYIIGSTTILFLLILTKYNSVFFLLGGVLFSVLYYRKRNYFYVFGSSLLAGLLFAFYLLFNKYITGDFTGERSSLDLVKLNFSKYISLSKYQIFPTIEPYGFSLIKIKELHYISGIWQLPYIISILIFALVCVIVLKLKSKKFSPMTVFGFILSFTFLLFTLFSAFYTKIDLLGPRLLLGFSFPLLFSICLFLKDNNVKINTQILIIVGTSSSLFYTITCFIYGF